MAAIQGYTSDLTQGPLTRTDTNRLFGGGSAGHKRPLVSRMSKEILPGVHSFSSDVLEFQVDYYDTLTARCPATVDESTGLSTNGVFETADKGKCVAGFMANPMGYTPRNNRLLRASLGLKIVPSHDFLTIVEDLTALVHSQWVESDINVTPGSSAGFVGFRHEAAWKIAFADYVFQPTVMADYLNMALGDELSFANRFETVFAYYSQKRDQVDAIGKKRPMWGLDHALNPDENPNDWQYADKRVVIDGKEWNEHSATRARLVNAAPWAINCVIAPVASGTMKSMFARWPSVWHVNTAAQVEELINGNHVWFGDASQFDQTHTEEGMDAYHNGVRKFWDSQVVDIAEKLLYAPYYARPLSLEGDPAWVGTVFSKQREVVCGNRSGHAWTSLYNKVKMVAAILYAIHEAGYKVIGNLDFWLEGKGPVKFINNGDDTVLYAKDKAALDRVIACLTGKNAVYKLARENGGVYNGMPTILMDAETLKYRCTQNHFSSIIKILTPERPVYNPKTLTELRRDQESGRKIFRKYWFLGLADKINNSYKDPVAEVVWGTFLEMWGIKMRNYLSIPEMLDIARKKVPPLGGHLSQADAEVLDDPRKLHYKWLPEEVTAKVLDEVTSKVSFSVFKQFIADKFKGIFVSKEEVSFGEKH